jgi:hypothetical protein
MLLPDNVHPENSIYYNGAIVLQVLQKLIKIEMLELYNKVNQVQNMSFPVFILCLDWLYLIDAAELKNEKVELCS